MTMIIDPKCTVARRDPRHECRRRDGRLLLSQREECFSQQRLDLMDPERVGGARDDFMERVDAGFYARARERAGDAAVMGNDPSWEF